MCRSCLYFSFNTLLMPQWIKIQSLFGNKQHTEHPAYTWVLYSESPQDFQWQYMSECTGKMTQRGLRPRSNHVHKCLLVSWISTLTLSHLVWTRRQGKELSESIRMHPRLTCVACYDAVSLHTSRGRNSKHSGQSFHSILPLITDWEVCTKKAGTFLSLLAFFFLM